MNDSDLLDELRARMEITDVLHLYCRAIDRVELDLLADVYHPGAIDEHGVYNGDAEGFVEALKAALAGPTSRFRMMQHSISNIMIERTGDSAKVQSHFRAYHRREDKSGKWDEALGGRYLDKFERRDGACRSHGSLLGWQDARECTEETSTCQVGDAWCDRAGGEGYRPGTCRSGAGRRFGTASTDDRPAGGGISPADRMIEEATVNDGGASPRPSARTDRSGRVRAGTAGG